MDTFVPVVIDIEASGFGQSSYPIEIGVVFSNGDKFCRLITPEEHWTYWDSNAESLHRITRKILLNHGISAKQMAEELNRRLAGMTVYSDCWTVDKPWLDKLYDAAGTKPSFKVRAIEMIMDEAQLEGWNQEHARNIDAHAGDRHRASTDAELIQQTWLGTKTRSRQTRRIVTVRG